MTYRIKTWLRQKAESVCTKLENSILQKSTKCRVVLGPVRSRRLGSVLGINNIKKKACSYNCIYCPSGKTSCCSICRNNCLSPYELHLFVRNKLAEIEKCGKKIDYMVFAGSGEPTLDSSLSNEISLLREFGYKIAVFTNSSLLWNDNIQESLLYADYVSAKVDTAIEETWMRINRPHRRLDYSHILNGIEQFSNKFQGILTTETMLIRNVNDNTREIEKLSEFLNSIKCKSSFFMTPMYPPAEKFAVCPDTETLNRLSVLIKEKVTNPVLLCCPETEEFFATDDFESELLGLLSLHPVGIDAVTRFAKSSGNLQKLNELIENGSIEEATYNDKSFYMISDLQYAVEI